MLSDPDFSEMCGGKVLSGPDSREMAGCKVLSGPDSTDAAGSTFFLRRLFFAASSRNVGGSPSRQTFRPGWAQYSYR